MQIDFYADIGIWPALGKALAGTVRAMLVYTL